MDDIACHIARQAAQKFINDTANANGADDGAVYNTYWNSLIDAAGTAEDTTLSEELRAASRAEESLARDIVTGFESSPLTVLEKQANSANDSWQLYCKNHGA